MFISQSYLQSLIGRKITLLESDLPDFQKLHKKPKGKIIDVTPDQQLIIKWFTQHHPNYTIDITTDRIHIHGLHAKEKTKHVSSKNNRNSRHDYQPRRSRIRTQLSS